MAGELRRRLRASRTRLPARQTRPMPCVGFSHGRRVRRTSCRVHRRDRQRASSPARYFSPRCDAGGAAKLSDVRCHRGRRLTVGRTSPGQAISWPATNGAGWRGLPRNVRDLRDADAGRARPAQQPAATSRSIRGPDRRQRESTANAWRRSSPPRRRRARPAFHSCAASSRCALLHLMNGRRPRGVAHD